MLKLLTLGLLTLSFQLSARDALASIEDSLKCEAAVLGFTSEKIAVALDVLPDLGKEGALLLADAFGTEKREAFFRWLAKQPGGVPSPLSKTAEVIRGRIDLTFQALLRNPNSLNAVASINPNLNDAILRVGTNERRLDQIRPIIGELHYTGLLVSNTLFKANLKRLIDLLSGTSGLVRDINDLDRLMGSLNARFSNALEVKEYYEERMRDPRALSEKVTLSEEIATLLTESGWTESDTHTMSPLVGSEFVAIAIWGPIDQPGGPVQVEFAAGTVAGLFYRSDRDRSEVPEVLHWDRSFRILTYHELGATADSPLRAIGAARPNMYEGKFRFFMKR